MTCNFARDDGWKRLKPFTLEPGMTVRAVLEAISGAAFGARDLGKAWQVAKHVIDDRQCSLVLTVSGAMTIAQMGPLFGALIDAGIVHAVVTTGAVVTHGLISEIGLSHYVHTPTLSDEHLYSSRINRVYDTYEPEENLEQLESVVASTLEATEIEYPLGSAEFVQIISNGLRLDHGSNGLLGAALRRQVPVFIPAMTDSELGLILFELAKRRAMPGPVYDPMRDLAEYNRWVELQHRCAILAIGGGVPRNWAQQMLAHVRSRSNGQIGPPGFCAGIRLCPDPAELGHLSGSTFAEAESWGKVSYSGGDLFAEVRCDATLVLPFLVSAAVDYATHRADFTQSEPATGVR